MNNLSDSTHLQAVYDISNAISSHLDLDEVLKAVMDVATKVLEVEASSLVTIDENNGDLLFHIAEGEKAKVIKQIRMKAGEGIVGAVIETQEPIVVNDVSKDTRFFKGADKSSGFVTKSIL
ncbi:MAG: GAF domain-containing protein, partial [Candidatus Cloacimonadota bacterium]|nr:GAF domain-containing protein [Candidatus Cloacimonadota bacterium]